MKTRTLLTLLAVGAAISLPSGAAMSENAANAGTAPQFRRGIGVAAMAWAAIEPGPAGIFAFPPFAGPSYALRFDELRTLQRTGFDFVRLAVDPGPFLQFTAARRDDLDRILIERVKLVLALGLAVLVDLHPSDMHPAYTAQALTAGPATPIFRAYLEMLGRIARLLGQLHSTQVALELMNEPPVAPEIWQPMLEAAYAAARRGSADLELVLEGGDEASAPALMQMSAAPFAGDRAVLYSFHYYEPYQFTHQGAPWNPARYLADVPYPAFARPLQDSLDATAAVIAGSPLSQPQKVMAGLDAQMRLRSYRQSSFDASTIAQTFDQIAKWARGQGLSPDQILLGEFGARETGLQRGGPRAAERAQWFHDVSEQATGHGFGWAVWAYRGEGGFALARSETSDEIEPNVAEALGLTPHPRAEAVPGREALIAEPRP